MKARHHNQLSMKVVKAVAERHSFVCLLYEKAFDGVNGSGKHNNWPLSTNTGIHLLEPLKTPRKNNLFLTVLCAILKGVDEYQDLLRISVASAGNGRRLGANKAPPAIVCVYPGEELTAVLRPVEKRGGLSGPQAGGYGDRL